MGVNERARRLLLPGLMASPRARLAAVCSRDTTRARAAAAALGPGIRPFTSVEEMAGSGEVDAVYVNTPTPAHAPACLAAIGARCAVICEKPLAGSTAEAGALCAAARAAGVRTAVNFTYRSVPGFRLTERILRQPGLGPPLHGEVALLQGHSFLPGYPRHSALLESGVHLLDTLLALARGAGMGRVMAVSATPLVGGPDSLPGPVDFGWAFLARSASGAVLVGHFSRAALGWRNGLRWGLYGERAALAVELDATRTEARLACLVPADQAGGAPPGGEWRPLTLPADLVADDARFPQYHLDRLVGAIRGEEPPGGASDAPGDAPIPDFGAALETHLLADALYASAAGGGWAPVATSAPSGP